MGQEFRILQCGERWSSSELTAAQVRP